MPDIHESYLEDILAAQTLDLRQTKYRFMDQKCTPDILYLIVECILALPEEARKNFARTDIEKSEAFRANLQFYFDKPDPTVPAVANEIDKVTGQPLKTLSYAGLLTEQKRGNRNYYSVTNESALQFLAANERNCFKFLVTLNTAVLRESGQLAEFERFRRGPWTADDYDRLRTRFKMFFLANSKLGSKGSVDGGDTEFRRIFPKILNPMAVYWGVPGTIGGRVGKEAFAYQELMYNRKNVRDKGKSKKTPRQEALALQQTDAIRAQKYLERENTKAKQRVLRFHERTSEVHDSLASGEATQAHHIFPVGQFPELQSIPENIIALTPSQHFQRAHPSNNTQRVDKEYQRTCLLSKLSSVKKAVAAGEIFYSKEQFVWVLREGLGLRALSAESSFDEIRLAIMNYA